MGFLKSATQGIAVLVLLISIFVYLKFIKTVPGPVIRIRDGMLQGIVLSSREGREYYGYMGIPYAKPPVGSLRFKYPQPPEKWQGVLATSGYKSFCIQYDYFFLGITLGSEDCLYLNVFVPAKIPAGKKLPVMFHIHGGYFHMGTTDVAGAKYFMDQDVILVTTAYRVGALGFLNTGLDGIVRGNMGLKDQNMALKWVQENIEHFGGDKSKVTIFGESAGGASVHYHMLSPASKGLFWRGIRQSGSALNYWTMYRNSKAQSQLFAKSVGCPADDSGKMVECLRNLDVYKLVQGHRIMRDQFPPPLIGKFAPSIETVKDEEAFLTEEPIELSRSGRFNKVPFIAGFNHDEGLLHSTVLWANQTKLDEANNDWFSWAPRAFHYDPSRRDVSQKLRDFYFGKIENLNSRDLIQNFTNLYGDRLFVDGVVKAAEIERKYVPAYLYIVDYESGFNFGTLMAFSQAKIFPIIDLFAERLNYLYVTYILGEEYHHPVRGTSHYDETVLLFNSPFSILYSNAKDELMSKDLVKLWADFASGVSPLKFRGVEFPPVKAEGDLKFLSLNYENPKIIDEPFKERSLLWESFNLKGE